MTYPRCSTHGAVGAAYWRPVRRRSYGRDAFAATKRSGGRRVMQVGFIGWGTWARQSLQTFCRPAIASPSTTAPAPRQSRSPPAGPRLPIRSQMRARARPSSRCSPTTTPSSAWCSARMACWPACRRAPRTFPRAPSALPCRSAWPRRIARPVSTSWQHPYSDARTRLQRASCSSSLRGLRTFCKRLRRYWRPSLRRRSRSGKRPRPRA